MAYPKRSNMPLYLIFLEAEGLFLTSRIPCRNSNTLNVFRCKKLLSGTSVPRKKQNEGKSAYGEVGKALRGEEGLINKSNSLIFCVRINIVECHD